jgi:hypothetical protein
MREPDADSVPSRADGDGGDGSDPRRGSFHNFEAIHDRGLDGALRLHVSGEIEYPDDCNMARLERMRSGINPRILMLRLTESHGSGCADVITRELVEWSEPMESEFDEIQILPGGPTLFTQCAH